MKQSDIALLVLIVAGSFLFAWFVGNMIFNTPDSRSTTVEVITSVDATLQEPSDDIFHSKAINPTEDITIEQSDTDDPFVR